MPARLATAGLPITSASTPDIAAMLLEHLDTPDDADAVAPLFRTLSDGSIPPRSPQGAGDQIASEMRQQGWRSATC